MWCQRGVGLSNGAAYASIGSTVKFNRVILMSMLRGGGGEGIDGGEERIYDGEERVHFD